MLFKIYEDTGDNPMTYQNHMFIILVMQVQQIFHTTATA